MEKNKLYVFIFIIIACSCKSDDREFFKSLRAENYFLDTFSAINLKGFGLSQDEKKINNNSYFDFNKSNNSIDASGKFYKSKDRLYFLPTNSYKALLVYDPILWKGGSYLTSNSVVTENGSTYESRILGLMFNKDVKDSTLNIAITTSNVLNRTECLIFEVTKDVDMAKITYVNCKNDTLIMSFFPKREVFYKRINRSSKCI